MELYLKKVKTIIFSSNVKRLPFAAFRTYLYCTPVKILPVSFIVTIFNDCPATNFYALARRALKLFDFCSDLFNYRYNFRISFCSFFTKYVGDFFWCSFINALDVDGWFSVFPCDAAWSSLRKIFWFWELPNEILRLGLLSDNHILGRE